jgi:hypothetical protein
MAGAFEILGRDIDRHSPTLPGVGDRIRLTVKREVFILEYARSGEKLALVWPDSLPPDRTLGPGDRTGIVLPPGAIVEIKEVQVSPARGVVRDAWARVATPIEEW